MLHSLPAGVSLIVLSFAAAVSSQPVTLYQQCWQTSVLQPVSGVQCSESDFKCICTSLSTRLGDFIDCTDINIQPSMRTPQGIRIGISSLVESCRNIRDTELPAAHFYAELQTALQAAKNDQLPPSELKARSTLDRGLQAEKKYIDRDLASTSAPPVASREASPSLPSLFPLAAPTPSISPTPSPILNNGMGPGTTVIPIYTDTPPLIVTDGATGTVSPTSKPTGSANSDGGTLLDMTSAAASRRDGEDQSKMLGLVVCLVACVVWF